MAYEGPGFRRHAAEGQGDPTSFIGLGDHRSGDDSGASGYPQTTAYQVGTGYSASGYQSASYRDATAAEEAGRPVTAAELEAVFDTDRRTGRDRMAVHWVWEALLLLAVGATGFLLWRADPGALRGGALELLLVTAAGFGLLGLAAGLSLRAAAPNLAIGPVAVAAGVYFAQYGDSGVTVTTAVAVVAALVLGAAVGLLVVGFQVPAWAASLGAAAAVVVWLRMQPDRIELAGAYDPAGQAAFLFALVVAMGIFGGLLGTLRGLRRAVGRFRPVGDPAQRRGAAAAVMASGAMMLSMAFAAVAGVLLVAGHQAPIGPGQPVEAASGLTWLTWTVIGFGAALAGGTSAFGRRGGVFGTVLAATGLVLFHRLQAVEGWEIALLATAAVALAGGLVVTRLVEALGGSPDDQEGEAASDGGRWDATASTRAEPATARDTGAAGGGDTWPAGGADSWSSALPARRTPGSTDPWDDDRWSSR